MRSRRVAVLTFAGGVLSALLVLVDARYSVLVLSAVVCLLALFAIEVDK